jgi:tRNA 2-selenouridine synthase
VGQSVNSNEVIQQLLGLYEAPNSPPSVALIDVRSPGEYEIGSIPGFSNHPVLNNTERHEVGLCYKQSGQSKAIELGLSLFSPVKQSRVDAWIQQARNSSSQQAWVLCWRGGLRSRLSTEFIRETQVEAFQIRGGYKALRQQLLATFERLPPVNVLTGLTGSGKTELLQELSHAIDLEKLAHHRGSAFGGQAEPQPAQASFENQLALEILKFQKGFVVEDESIQIGRIGLPPLLKKTMNASPACLLESPLEERALRIFEGYVADPIRRGISPAALEASLQGNLLRVQRRLGGMMYSIISQELKNAFAQADSPRAEDHLGWISKLLTHYYDKMYEHALERSDRKISYRGDRNGCKQWLQNQFASLKP